MKQILHQIANIALAGTLVFGLGTATSLAQNIGPCLGPVAAQNAKNNGLFMPLVAIKRMHNIHPNAAISNLRVCQVNGQPHYIFDVFPPNGNARHFVLRATDGTPYIAG